MAVIRKKRFFKALILFIGISITFWFLPFTSSQDDFPTLNARVNSLISKYKLTKSKIGIRAVSLSEGKSIYSKNSGTLLTPASNLKIFTTGAALCILGKDFNYETTLYRSGVITDGILTGNLIVTSNGNPNISGRFYEGNTTAVFEDWGDTLLSLGIKGVIGDVVIDDTAFDRDYLVDSWPSNQLACWYCAPVSAVSFNDNCIDITVFPEKGNGKVLYRLDPNTESFKVVNECKQTSRKSQHAIYFAKEYDDIVIKGRCYSKAGGFKESIPIDNPPVYFGSVLKETLRIKKGIRITGTVRLATRTYNSQNDDLRKITSTKTDLLTTLAVTNKNSQNFYAEQILKTIGYYSGGKGSFNNGVKQIEKFLRDNKILASEDDYTQVDGSGLSPKNRITANQMINLLSYLYKTKYGEEFRETLAVNGVDGTLKNRLKSNGKNHKIWAKTGYIKNVSALSGYLQTKKDNDIAFSIIINNVSDISRARQFQEKLLDLLMEY
jgi:D-alanyl-D-alanine carboxypeptidase/D-alanyl-D-alanine-endopeptidase (penicillin-binding protein 4)